MNEATFKPLFTRLYDWAVVDLSENSGSSYCFLMVKQLSFVSPRCCTTDREEDRLTARYDGLTTEIQGIQNRSLHERY